MSILIAATLQPSPLTLHQIGKRVYHSQIGSCDRPLTPCHLLASVFSELAMLT